MVSLKKQFFHSSSWMILGTSFNQLSTFVVFVVLSRLLDPAEFGLVAFGTLFIDIARPVVAGGIGEALVKEEKWDQTYASTAFWLNTIVAAVVGILVLAVGFAALAITDQMTVAAILTVLTISLFVESLQITPTALLRREFRYKELTKRIAVTSLVSGFAGIALAYVGWGAWALVAQRVISTSTGAIFIWTSAKWRPSRVFDRKAAGNLGRFAIGMISSQMLSNLNGQIAGVVIGFGIGPTALALYRTGNRILILTTQLVIAPIQRVALSAFSRAAPSGQIADIYKRLTAACALIACPAFIGLGSVSYDLIEVLFGPKWIESGSVMMASSFVVGVYVINYFLTPSLAAKGNVKSSAVYFGTALVGNTIFAIISAPFGLMAVVLSQTFRGYLGLPVSLSILKKEIGLSPTEIIGVALTPFLASAAMGGTLIAVRHWLLMDSSAVVRLLILLPAGAMIYAILMVLIGNKLLRNSYAELKPMLPDFIAKRINRA